MATVNKIHSGSAFERKVFKIDYNQMLAVIKCAGNDFEHYKDEGIGEEVDLLDDVEGVMEKWFAYPRAIEEMQRKVLRAKFRSSGSEYLEICARADDQRTGAHNDAITATCMLYRICQMMGINAPYPDPQKIHRRDIGKGVCDFVAQWIEEAY